MRRFLCIAVLLSVFVTPSVCETPRPAHLTGATALLFTNVLVVDGQASLRRRSSPVSPRRRSYSPRRRSYSPRRRSYSPRRRRYTPTPGAGGGFFGKMGRFFATGVGIALLVICCPGLAALLCWCGACACCLKLICPDRGSEARQPPIQHYGQPPPQQHFDDSQGGRWQGRPSQGGHRTRSSSSSSSSSGDSDAQVAATFPSGLWSGYYNQRGRNHGVAEFRFDVDPRCRISGMGVDEVGQYTIDGGMAKRGRKIKFKKRYITGTPNVHGFIDHESNEGHIVKYKGERVGHGLQQGYRGVWKIKGEDSGGFHIWPAMPNWQQYSPPPAYAPGAAAPGGYAPGAYAHGGHLPLARAEPLLASPGLPAPSAPVIFQVSPDNICVVCYERPIDTCLLPCSHVALCSTCAGSCRSSGCPICRARIDYIARHDGQGAPPNQAARMPAASAPPLNEGD